MNYLSKKQLVGFAIIFLVVINIATITTFIYHILSEQDVSLSTINNKEKGVFLSEELDFNNSQLEKYQEIKNNFHLNSEKLNRLLNEKTIEMFDELSETNSDTSMLNNIAMEIGKLNEKLKKQTINQFLEIESICTDSQKQKLYKTYDSMLQCIWPGQGTGRKYRGGRGQGFQGKGRYGNGSGKGNPEFRKNN